MLLYILSDRPPTMKREEIDRADLIITLGDLEGHYLNIFDGISKPKVGVYGNHDYRGYLEEHGFTNLHLKTFTFQGVTFGGFEGSLKYKESKYHPMYTQEEAMDLVGQLPPVDVLISHSPPFGLHDWPDDLAHTGLKALTWYIDRHKPRYHFHGHVDILNEDVRGTTVVKGAYQDIFYEIKL